MANSVLVRHYMTRPMTVNQNVSVAEASQVILQNKLSGIVVVNDAGELVGMLSELDCLDSIVDAAYNGGVPGAAKVSDVMTKDVETNHPDEDILNVAKSRLQKSLTSPALLNRNRYKLFTFFLQPGPMRAKKQRRIL